MRWTSRRIFAGGFVLISLLLLACGDDTPAEDAADKGGASIAGFYGCGLEGNPDAPGMFWELRQDGTLTNQSPPDIVALGTTAEEKIVSGTWAVTGTSGTVTSENQVYPFVIEQGRLVFRDGKFVCRPAGSPSPGATR